MDFMLTPYYSNSADYTTSSTTDTIYEVRGTNATDYTVSSTSTIIGQYDSDDADPDIPKIKPIIVWKIEDGKLEGINQDPHKVDLKHPPRCRGPPVIITVIPAFIPLTLHTMIL